MRKKNLRQHMRMALYSAGLSASQIGLVSYRLRQIARQLHASVWPYLPIYGPTPSSAVRRSLLSYPEYRELARARKTRKRMSLQRALALGHAYGLYVARICDKPPTDPEVQAQLQRWADELEPMWATGHYTASQEKETA